MGGTVVISVTLVLAAIAAWIYRDREMKAPLPIVTFGLVLALGYGVFTHDRDIATEKRRSDCISRVERSIGNRSFDLAIIRELRAASLDATADRLTADLDRFLPALSLDDC